MTFDIRGVPRETCHYKHDKATPGILQADCNGDWIVLQDDFLYCPFCGRAVEKNPPPKPRTVA